MRGKNDAFFQLEVAPRFTVLCRHIFVFAGDFFIGISIYIPFREKIKKPEEMKTPALGQKGFPFQGFIRAHKNREGIER
ncbi:hypothetical protein CN380_11435 [Bacillus sp. AFS017274]|nr:hypothetical protein CN380_11435 [Bacillus sp. AFS017274]